MGLRLLRLSLAFGCVIWCVGGTSGSGKQASIEPEVSIKPAFLDLVLGRVKRQQNMPPYPYNPRQQAQGVRPGGYPAVPPGRPVVAYPGNNRLTYPSAGGGPYNPQNFNPTYNNLDPNCEYRTAKLKVSLIFDFWTEGAKSRFDMNTHSKT